MKAAGVQGVIINVTSAAGLRGGLSPADYAASKAGVVALTQQAACEFAGHGIRVNSVAPAYVSTVRRFSAVILPAHLRVDTCSDNFLRQSVQQRWAILCSR